MEITNLLIETLVTTIPTIVIVVVLYLAIRQMMFSYVKLKMYDQDKYRIQLENELSNINSKITLGEERFKSVNHLLLDGNENSFSGAEGFLSRMGINSNIEPQKKTVFILTPMNPEYQKDYEWIKEGFSKHNYICTRGDDINVNENLLSHIIGEMLASTFVVANISGRNPNVFYELGIAHALGKDIVLVTRSANDITFDLSSSQVVVYNKKDDLLKGIDKWLVSTLESKFYS